MSVDIDALVSPSPLTFVLSDGRTRIFEGYALLPDGENGDVLHYKGVPTEIAFGRLARAVEIYKAVAEHSRGVI